MSVEIDDGFMNVSGSNFLLDFKDVNIMLWFDCNLVQFAIFLYFIFIVICYHIVLLYNWDLLEVITQADLSQPQKVREALPEILFGP